MADQTSTSQPQIRDATDEKSLPIARIEQRRSVGWIIWLVPLAAAVLAIWLGVRAWSMRGVSITVQLNDGYGLKQGDDVRYRGISVGYVDDVTLAPGRDGVLIKARLKPGAAHLARSGTRFWVVRPRVRLTRVEGLDTLIGPRYLAVLPADSEPEGSAAQLQRDFIGLEQAPIVEAIEPGDLEIILQAQQRGSMHQGAPVTYRQTRIGTILSVGLNGDGSAVEARAHIERPFVNLLRPDSRFWDVGGVKADFGLTGVSVEIDSAEAFLTGGIAMATPPPSSPEVQVVHTGHRFDVAPHPEKDWLQWQPLAIIGSEMLPAGTSPPSPLRASLGWTQGRWLRGERTVHGWLLQTAEGLLGPADLLKPAEKADPGTVVLEVAGEVVPLHSPPVWVDNGLALLKQTVTPNAWPPSRLRHATHPEECLVVADPADRPIPLAASRLTPGGTGIWKIDPAVVISKSSHGGCVISREDGKLLGLLLVQDGSAVVGLLPRHE